MEYEMRIAHVDDSKEILTANNKLLKHRGIKTLMCEHPIALNAIQGDLDLILSDGENIIDGTIKARDSLFPGVPILIYSGNESLVSNYALIHKIKGVVKPVCSDYLAERILEYKQK